WVEEAHSITWGGCELITLKNEEQQEAVKMSVFGKHGRRRNVREDAYGLYHAVDAYKFLKKSRPEAEPTRLLFEEGRHREGMKRLLIAANLRHKADLLRSSRSLRTTGISVWGAFSKNPNYSDIAKWARTSVDMLTKWYDQNPV